MYNISVESPLFVGRSLVEQHKLVTTSISDDLKSIHGYNLKTKVPETVKPKAEQSSPAETLKQQ